MNHNRQAPTVQAGSMADIAFLLLIFFLVATKVPNDTGLARKLPNECLNPPCTVDINERNILEIAINKHNEIAVEGNPIDINSLKDSVKSFLDNNGDGTCTYCKGESIKTSSDNPNEAVISLATDRESSYEQFVSVQNEITKAFKELRADYAFSQFGKTENLTDKQMTILKEAYPFKLSEAEIK